MVGRVLRSIAAFALVSVVTPITCVIVIIGALIFLPLPATLPEPKPILESDVTHIMDSTGNTEIAVYKHFETFIKVEQADIPQVVKDAVVSAEDKHFYEHGGVDIPSTLRDVGRHPEPRRGARRLDDHAAVREERVHHR